MDTERVPAVVGGAVGRVMVGGKAPCRFSCNTMLFLRCLDGATIPTVEEAVEAMLGSVPARLRGGGEPTGSTKVVGSVCTNPGLFMPLPPTDFRVACGDCRSSILCG